MVFKFLHNNFNVLNLEKSLKFYEDALGLKAVSYTHLDVYKRQVGGKPMQAGLLR